MTIEELESYRWLVGPIKERGSARVFRHALFEFLIKTDSRFKSDNTVGGVYYIDGLIDEFIQYKKDYNDTILEYDEDTVKTIIGL